MSEKNMWTNVRKKMVPHYWLEATRHEDAYQRGIADVSFVQRDANVGGAPSSCSARHGWMELKYRGMAPIRAGTICKIDHYTDDQRIWLRDKGNAGGMTFLMLQLGRCFLLFDHVQCQDVGRVTSRELFDLACWNHDGLDARGLWEAINEFG
jgi:hypothetical protein